MHDCLCVLSSASVYRSEAEQKLTKRQTLREQALQKTQDVRDVHDTSTNGAMSLLV